MATRKAPAKATPAKRSAPQVAPQDNWQARSDMSTLSEAAKIRADPKRFNAAAKEAQASIQALQKIKA